MMAENVRSVRRAAPSAIMTVSALSYAFAGIARSLSNRGHDSSRPIRWIPSPVGLRDRHDQRGCLAPRIFAAARSAARRILRLPWGSEPICFVIASAFLLSCRAVWIDIA